MQVLRWCSKNTGDQQEDFFCCISLCMLWSSFSFCLHDKAEITVFLHARCSVHFISTRNFIPTNVAASEYGTWPRDDGVLSLSLVLIYAIRNPFVRFVEFSRKCV